MKSALESGLDVMTIETMNNILTLSKCPCNIININIMTLWSSMPDQSEDADSAAIPEFRIG